VTTHEYKERCSKPDAFPRGALEETVRELSRCEPGQCDVPTGPLLEPLRAILAEPPIEKPELHRGDRSTDFFSVSRVSKDEAAAIADVFVGLEVGCVDPVTGEITGSGGDYAALCGAWNNFSERYL
jgi:hypothetical protein